MYAIHNDLIYKLVSDIDLQGHSSLQYVHMYG